MTSETENQINENQNIVNIETKTIKNRESINDENSISTTNGSQENLEIDPVDSENSKDSTNAISEISKDSSNGTSEISKNDTPRSTQTPTPEPPPTPEKNTISALNIHKRKRLPHDILGKLEDSLQIEPRNVNTWLKLIKQVRKKDKIDEIRTVYERLTKVYPTSANFWIQYLEFELSNSEFYRVEQLFSRCLPQVFNITIWSFYLGYVRRMNNITTQGQAARTTISQAFEFVISKVGNELNSTKIWSDYLDFIKSGPSNTTWEQQQKMDSTRKIYQRLLTIPVVNLENFWQEYNLFENNLNKLTARKFMSDKLPLYNKARSVLKELVNLTSNIVRNSLPQMPCELISQDPPSSSSYVPIEYFDFSPENKHQIELWKAWAEYEQTNPLDYSSQNDVFARVMTVYKQALSLYQFSPDLWMDVISYAISCNRDSEVIDLFKSAVAMNPTNFMLHLKYAEYRELLKQKDDARNIYRSLIENLKSLNERYQTRAAEELLELKSKSDNNSTSSNGNSNNTNSLSPAPNRDLKNSTRNALITNNKIDIAIEKLNSKLKNELDQVAVDLTLAYSFFMRASKRFDGIKSARSIFSEARKLTYVTPHIFIEAAYMEYNYNKNAEIAVKIFEIGLKRFSDNSFYVLQYLDFLFLINDDTNARSLFEKSIKNKNLNDDSIKILYEKFYNYESRFNSDIEYIIKLENRVRSVYPSFTPIKAMESRYNILDIDSISRGNFFLLASSDVSNFIIGSKRRANDSSSVNNNQSMSNSSFINAEDQDIHNQSEVQNLDGNDQSSNSNKRTKTDSFTTSNDSNDSNETDQVQSGPLAEIYDILSRCAPGVIKNQTQEQISFIPPIAIGLIAAMPFPSTYEGAKFNSNKLVAYLTTLEPST